MRGALRVVMRLTAAAAIVLAGSVPAGASSHMDAPLITLDDAANTTDVYAFVSQRLGKKYMTTALAVYPHEEPGIGPNKYNFDDNVLYEIRVATGADAPAGRTTIGYRFRFNTTFRNRNTILQSYLGVVNDVGDASQNLIQRYTVTKVDYRSGQSTLLGRGIVPPNNQGIATPRYNQGDDGNNPAKEGVASETDLDPYTAQSIADLAFGYQAFAGQRDDGFYADVQAVFDLLKLRGPGQGFDSQGGFNVHTIVLNIPLEEIGGDKQVVGVYATTSRRQVSILSTVADPVTVGEFIQVARQGNPLFNEALVAIQDKDRYSRTNPQADTALFKKYALTPELAALLNALVLGGNVAPTINRTDIAGIFIPDLIKVDLSTGPARLAGGGPGHPTPDDPGFSRLGIFGGDTLTSKVQTGFGGGVVPGGWPNGRRFGDDVLDIAVSALISDLRVTPPIIRVAGDNTDKNDIAYNKVFPYAATPLNGRNHIH